MSIPRTPPLPLYHARQSTIAHVYILTVLLGTVLSWTLGIVESADPVATKAAKRGWLNAVFVKWGWSWTTLPLLALAILPSLPPPFPPGSWRAPLRWALATAYWFFLTQWFFGHAVFDRVLHAGAARCERDPHLYGTARSCKKGGHEWLGFDISGHTFLLVHASLVLLEELPASPLWRHFESVMSSAYRSAASFIASLDKDNGRRKKLAQVPRGAKRQTPPAAPLYPTPHATRFPTHPPHLHYAHLAALVGSGVLLLMWYASLVKTSLWFHTVGEKVLGLLFGVAWWAGSYAVWKVDGGASVWSGYGTLGIHPGAAEGDADAHSEGANVVAKVNGSDANGVGSGDDGAARGASKREGGGRHSRRTG
ncbi:hypothetical protein M427DRAFT_52717 [Gonapodya prolifera JEL478]|uniref:Inositol phospholipid synthesis and fat-storage-inducing TM-domain-containing protein n=1 Tax=Gonapodya prolifera (strain JEL478) TaxID=1344416 RepID=A0A139AT13_GONPJ|nr:hypothetical protein M427DRAFT_52717 [Gonapodya prolifera JEL478]|eukprot:KXS19877.1 hypothetical protein M427DRAFT_52717 [Gonapodya prolifera JEL478]